jgi:hypothetical protein
VPVASSSTKLVLDEAAYKGIEKQLDLGQKSLDAVLEGGEKLGTWLGRSNAPELEQGAAIEARGSAAAAPGLAEGKGSGLRRTGVRDEQAAGVPVGASAVRKRVLSAHRKSADKVVEVDLCPVSASRNS